MTVKKPAEVPATIEIPGVDTRQITVGIVGSTPLIYNALSEKARHELLYPAAKLIKAGKSDTPKHNPIEEYRNSVYRYLGEDRPTRLYFRASAIKKAMMAAVTDLPDIAKTQIARLVRVTGETIDIYGTPEIFMTDVKNSGINRTPDIRTRAILKEWGCTITVAYRASLFTEKSIVNLLYLAGESIGIGDWRQEKGSGDYGLFLPVSADDEHLSEIKQAGSKEAQDVALRVPHAYDDQTQSLLTWWNGEHTKRGRNFQPIPDVTEDIVATQEA